MSWNYQANQQEYPEQKQSGISGLLGTLLKAAGSAKGSNPASMAMNAVGAVVPGAAPLVAGVQAIGNLGGKFADWREAQHQKQLAALQSMRGRM